MVSFKSSLSVSNVQLGLRNTDVGLRLRPGGQTDTHMCTHTHALSCLPYLSSRALDGYNTIEQIVYLHLCIVLILISKVLVGTLEFRMERGGLYPVNYLNPSSSPRAGTMAVSPCAFPNRIQMETELIYDSKSLGMKGCEVQSCSASWAPPLPKQHWQFGCLPRGETFLRGICPLAYGFPMFLLFFSSF